MVVMMGTGASARPNISSLHVMIVEDRPGVLTSIEAMVESWRQVEITSVQDFIGAATWIKALDRLDLLLCDVCLPGEMDGLGVARVALATHPNVAIVMFSADHRSEIKDMSDRYRFLQKPFGRDALIRQIDDAFVRLRTPVSVG
jgi:DNA-binding NtrC family response regulator